MNSIVEAKVADYLKHALRYNVFDCGTALETIRSLARVSGHDLDERFASAGLAAGPEARVASRIVGRAIGDYGDETPEHAMRKEVDLWLRRNPRKGRL